MRSHPVNRYPDSQPLHCLLGPAASSETSRPAQCGVWGVCLWWLSPVQTQLCRLHQIPNHSLSRDAECGERGLCSSQCWPWGTCHGGEAQTLHVPRYQPPVCKYEGEGRVVVPLLLLLSPSPRGGLLLRSVCGHRVWTLAPSFCCHGSCFVTSVTYSCLRVALRLF